MDPMSVQCAWFQFADLQSMPYIVLDDWVSASLQTITITTKAARARYGAP